MLTHLNSPNTSLKGPFPILKMSTQVEDFPSGAAGKESACNAGAAADWGLIPGSERSPGGGNNNPLQYSCPEKSYGTEGALGLQSVGSLRVRHA